MSRILDRERGRGMDATAVYGLTEATGGTHFTRRGDPLDKRVATVGRILDVSIVGVPEFPLTGSGKVQKFKQRAWAIETDGLRRPG